MDDLPGERVHAPERVDEEGCERRQVDHGHPADRRRKLGGGPQPAAPPERDGQAAAGPPQEGPAASDVRRYEITSFQDFTHWE
jgi:hypothetical protein